MSKLMSKFTASPTTLPGVLRVERKPLSDERGFFSRLWCAEEFSALGWSFPIQQINQSLTKSVGSIRGLHFQLPPHSEMKLVSCLKGEIFDVAVDLRKGSPTFLHWHSQILSESNQRALLIPEGFAHGFQVLKPETELLYLHTRAYHPEAEAGIRSEDPKIAIQWPLPVTDRSARDMSHPLISDGWEGIVL